MIHALSRTLGTFFVRKPPPKNVIFIGIDYGCYSLATSLLENNARAKQVIQIVAFIDDEPWNNRTQIQGTTVFSPSEISALVRKRKVAAIIQIQGESLRIADNIWEDVLNTKVDLITLDQHQDTVTMRQAIYDALETKTQLVP
ncbi:nucleoside-diphosphate sugar epimerase/dehydratase [Marinomonas sp. IMCC 4694]|uniref:nucleoside-diphosphate sugar epimerase/dehydratase n=1 Tax=Marinomonas sp. IMCC 4694 TaxID=2605432 RepID=UPI0011E86D19|nr:hypothetical protein [Marinomonas sp. IMCC 4694]TYL48153.1 hypothetical protein FXV75_09510 [Marinomonas sp. IMCC 4694]